MFALERSDLNPLIEPRPENAWEEKSTFNPGGIYEDKMFHLFYRATSMYDISSIGYAAFTSDMRISERPNHPVLTPDEEWEEFGCEDPRITCVDDTYFMLYTAFSRRGPRIALASGYDRRLFSKNGVIGPDIIDKDAMLFPEAIGGKLALIHRIESSIQIAYFDSEEFRNLGDPSFRSKYWKEYLHNLEAHTIMRPKEWWEARKIGAGPPPIKTPEGWLVIYHGVDVNKVYRTGVALLDPNDPSKIVARSRTPILSPERPYEKNGIVNDVVFAQAAMVSDGVLYVFYGAADKVCCLAVAKLEELLRWLLNKDSGNTLT